MSFLALVPWAWFVITGGALWFLNAKRDSTAPYFTGSPATNPHDQLAVVLRSGPESIKRIEFAHNGLNLRVVNETNETAFYTDAEIPFARLPANSAPVTEFLTRLHRGRVAGVVGQIAFSLIALFLLGFIVTGIFLTRKSRLRERRWHRTLGYVSALPLTLVFLSGGLWNLSAQLRPVPRGDETKVLRAMDWKAAFARANQILPSLKSLHRLPGAILAEGADGSRVYFNSDGSVRVFKAWSWRGWLEPLFQIHSGRILGWGGRILLLFTASFGLILIFTGVQLQRSTSRRPQS